jgi:hypothetical protein
VDLTPAAAAWYGDADMTDAPVDTADAAAARWLFGGCAHFAPPFQPFGAFAVDGDGDVTMGEWGGRPARGRRARVRPRAARCAAVARR